MKADIYLNFEGNTETVFNFYKTIFGGEFAMLQRFKEMQGFENPDPSLGDKILHVALPLGNGNTLMGSDSMTSMGHPVHPGNNFHISLSCQSLDEANRVFNALSSGGKVTMPLEKSFWGAYFGMCVDQFGIQWMVSFNEGQPG